jgi:sulfate adenylyltransferase subunit 2
VIEFRDQRVANWARLVVGHVEDSIKRGTVRLRKETDSRNAAQAVTLLETIEAHGFDALIGGARRDEERRAKERIFSFRDEFGQWDPKAQRPELWSLYNARMHKASTCACSRSRTGPSSTCGSTSPAKTSLPPIYYAHQREWCAERPAGAGDADHAEAGWRVSEVLSVRFRTVGDISCTCPVASTAATPVEIIAETAVTEITERGATRMDDQTSEASMERRKKKAI